MSELIKITFENQVVLNALLKGLTISQFSVDKLEFDIGGDNIYKIKTTNGKRIKIIVNFKGDFIEI